MLLKDILILVCISSVLIAQTQLLHLLDKNDSKSYGVEIYLNKPNLYGGFAEEEDHLIILKDNKLVKQWRSYSIKPLYQGDIDLDGYKEVVVLTHSGGMHCCFELDIIRIHPKGVSIFTIDLQNATMTEIKDLDGDGQAEIITLDDRYSDEFGFSFADSVFVKVVVNMKDEELYLNPELMKKYTKPDRLNVSCKQKEDFTNPLSDLISTMLYYFYTGEAKKAVELMKQYNKNKNCEYHLDKNDIRSLFRQMALSEYWEQICQLNDWCKKTKYSNGKKQCIESLSAKDVEKLLLK